MTEDQKVRESAIFVASWFINRLFDRITGPVDLPVQEQPTEPPPEKPKVKTVNKSQLRLMIPPERGVGNSSPDRVNKFVDHPKFPRPTEDTGHRGRNDRRTWALNQELRDAIEEIVAEEEQERDDRAFRL